MIIVVSYVEYRNFYIPYCLMWHFSAKQDKWMLNARTVVIHLDSHSLRYSTDPTFCRTLLLDAGKATTLSPVPMSKSPTWPQSHLAFIYTGGGERTRGSCNDVT